MVIRRGGSQKLFHAISVTRPLLLNITRGGGGGGGGFHVKKKSKPGISQLRALGNLHSNFGARRSRHLGVRSATN